MAGFEANSEVKGKFSKIFNNLGISFQSNQFNFKQKLSKIRILNNYAQNPDDFTNPVFDSPKCSILSDESGWECSDRNNRQSICLRKCENQKNFEARRCLCGRDLCAWKNKGTDSIIRKFSFSKFHRLSANSISRNFNDYPKIQFFEILTTITLKMMIKIFKKAMHAIPKIPNLTKNRRRMTQTS